MTYYADFLRGRSLEVDLNCEEYKLLIGQEISQENCLKMGSLNGSFKTLRRKAKLHIRIQTCDWLRI
jgi:hypothetical protein